MLVWDSCETSVLMLMLDLVSGPSVLGSVSATRSWRATKAALVPVMQGELNQATLPTEFLHRKLPTKAFFGTHN